MIGLFLGGTDFPKLILEKIKRKRLEYFIIDLTKKNLFKNYKNSYFISIGKFGKILKLLNEKKCKKVLFAGKIEKPRITNLKLDIKGIYYLPRIIKAFKLGDAAILKELINILAENKIKVIKSNSFNSDLTLKKGVYTKIKPIRKALIQIKSGIKSFQKLNVYDHTQAIIVEQNGFIYKETSKGPKLDYKYIKYEQTKKKKLTIKQVSTITGYKHLIEENEISKTNLIHLLDSKYDIKISPSILNKVLEGSY